MKYAALLLCLLVNAASANGLDDLKAALAPLKGEGAVRGVYELRQQSIDNDKKEKAPEAVAVQATIEEDAGGMSIRWDKNVLRKAADEDKVAKGAKRVAPVSGAISNSSPTRIAQAVNYAPALLNILANCQLKGEKQDSYQGKPAKLLELNYTDPAVPDDKLNVKENTRTAQVWVGADGLPLAATIQHKMRASAFMVLSFEHSGKEEYVFNTVANRLVVLKREETGNSKGLGSDKNYKNSYSFTPKA